MNESLRFYAFRYFLIPTVQTTIFQSLVSDKNQIMRDVFDELESKNKIAKILDRKYLLYFIDKLDKDIYICKFAKEKHFTKYEEGEIDINNIKDLEYPYIYIIIDLKRQIVLIENKTSIFRTINAAKNKLIEWITIKREMFDYNLKVDEITYEHVFWDYVKNSNNIYELTLKMKSPNLFDGWLEANELLKKLKSIFNNTETQIKFSNENGKLVILKEQVESYIKYITGGGGDWLLKAYYNGVTRILKSKNNVKIINFPKVIEQNFNQFKELILNKLYDIEDVLIEGKNKDEKKD